MANPRFKAIPLKTLNFATGTWTYTPNSGNPYYVKTATDETSTITIPIYLPFRKDSLGNKLIAVNVPMRITTDDLDAVIAGTLVRRNVYKAVDGAGTDIDTTTMTITETGEEVTAAATDRLYTATVSSPAFIQSTTITYADYTLTLSVNAGTSSVVRVYAPFVEFEELVGNA